MNYRSGRPNNIVPVFRGWCCVLMKLLQNIGELDYLRAVQ